MDIQEMLVEGSSKKVYATNQSDQVVLTLSDAFPLVPGKKKETMSDKAAINNAISAFVFEYLESYNVPSHFIKTVDAKSFLARKLDMIPIVVTVYNVSSRQLAERFGIEAGKVLEFPVVEMYFKNGSEDMPMINEYHAYALGLCDRKEMTSITRIATKVNAVLKSFFDRRKLKLINFRLEFGRGNNQILLGDEVSLDTMSIWNVKEDGSLDELEYGTKKAANTYKDLQSRILGNNQ